jgi:hypothetical protein
MRSFAFYFNAETFQAKRRQVASGQSVPIDYLGAADRLPFNALSDGDELFVVGVDAHRVHLGGRLIVSGRPIPREEAVRQSGRRDLIDKPLICLANLKQLDTFRPDLTVPANIATNLQLFSTTREMEATSLRKGQPDPGVFRSMPRLSEASAHQLRSLLGLSRCGDIDTGNDDLSYAPPSGADNDEYRQRAIKTRRGQSKFRQALLNAYGRRCSITRCPVEELLEAAHITPHAELTDYDVSNGLLLRADIHTLFDLDLITVDETYCVRVSPRLKFSEYKALNGNQLARLPEKTADQPNRESLRNRALRLKLDAAVG